MLSPTIHVSVVDASGTKRTFRVERLILDCGLGQIEISAGEPSFCRGFERGVLTLFEGGATTTMNITGGMASLAQDTIQVVCEHAIVTPSTEKISLHLDDSRPSSANPK